VSAGLTFFFICIFSWIHIAWWISPIIVFIIGLGKEVYDYFHPKTHTCDIKDLLADCVGIATVSIVYFLSF
jgi:hypothetical protein